MSKRTALYRHFDAAGALLYVGISLNALNRLGQHRDNAHWFDRIAKVDIEWFPSRPAALAAEAIAIASECPLCNRARPAMGASVPRCSPWASVGEPVKVRGEALHPVHWHNQQWAVSEYGIERRDGRYAIGAGSLLRKRTKSQYDWPLHMAEKDWVDMRDFQQAFAVACWIHHGIPITQHFSERARG